MPTVVAVNIPHTLSVADARHDSELAMKSGDVVLACEIDTSNDGPFEDAAHRAGKRVRFRWRKTEVAHPAGWRDVHAQLYRLTKPIPGVNPGRDLAALFNHTERVVYCTAHMTNGKNKPGKSARRLRVIKWRNYEAKAARLVERWVDAGWNVVIGGDLNDVKGAQFHQRQETAVHAGLMWLIVVAARGRAVQVRNPDVIRSNRGDHPVIAADITFEEKQ